MDKELAYIILLPISSLLFMLGGTYHKAIRRFLLSTIFLIMMLFYNIPLGKALIVNWLYIGAFCLGYGETKPYWYKFLVGISYSLPTLFLGLSFWQLIIPAYFIILFILSNWKSTKYIFEWKIIEGTIGFLIGINLAYLITK